MPRQQLPPQIKPVTLQGRRNGRPIVKYQLTVDTGIVDGKRKQLRKRFDTEAEARAELAKVIDQRASGTYVAKRLDTVSETVARWIAGRPGWNEVTRVTHRNRLKPLIVLYGDLPVQDLKKSHLDNLMERLRLGDIPRPDERRRRPSNGQSRRNVLSSIRELLASEMKQGHIPRNVAQLVDAPKLDSEERPTLTVEELQRVLDITASDRDGHQHWLGSLGLRKQELAGLGWEHIDMEAHTIQIVRTRTIADGKVVIGKPKTKRSRRELPIPDPVYSSLLHARAVQHRERLEAGTDYQESGYVFVDALGRPVYPDYLTDRWKAACGRAGVPVINLHDERHTCATLMILNGVPIPTVSEWLGHATAAFTMARYVHNQPYALTAASTTLAGLVSTKNDTELSGDVTIRDNSVAS
ncbi:tyrosine-type recombinase/integrase [Rhodococcus sp. IEGM 1351]|uniref:site-specific integrase n=1 Tax=Rhodococcus sp. IEGM 1351 TaxID=3047089 RepID=UPI0024B83EC0|nr:site-specific integrase [Rhodococcus sp. IEGM 1351]MDI9934747.1 tyrosine-type recombinase/integrase [Rhodococcus sp. IEGM 1351]